MTILSLLTDIVGAAFESEGLSAEYGEVRRSDRPDLAQYQCNGALAAAKAEKKNPRAIGQAVADRLVQDPRFGDISLAGPGFINITLSDDFLGQQFLTSFADEHFGGWQVPTASTVVLDFGGPNVAKPLHVGHLRSAIIGECLKRVMRFCGDSVIGDVHLGDWGLQMGQVISELELRQPSLPYFSDASDVEYPATPPISLADLEELYPAASAACKEDPARADIARTATKALQDGHPGYRALWRAMVDMSIAAMKDNYKDLGVSFDLWKGEADADPFIADMVQDLRTKGLVEDSDGAQIIRVAQPDDKKEIPPVILVNSQGAVGYHATDIATIIDRAQSHQPDHILYVVDNRQGLHFEQVFRVSDMADYTPAEKLEHIGFGTMQGKDGKPFKTRAGGLVKLRDLIETVTAKASERLQENGLAASLDGQEKEAVAQKIGVAALKFADLSNQRTADYIFDMDRFMAFEGKTGPYLLYASVRARSVLAKAADAGALPGDTIAISDPAERDLVLLLLQFHEAVRQAYEKRMPHFLCEHAFSLAQGFSKFYASCRMVDEPDETLRSSRLLLTKAFSRQLDLVLSLLGLEPPDAM